MKTIFFAFLVFAASSLNAQTLKEALYGGRLKNDSGSVVHKTDDLKTKIDSTRPAKPIEQPAAGKTGVRGADNSGAAGNNPASGGTASNAEVWKKFVEDYSTLIRTDVMPSKKIKSGTYSVLIDYEIGLDGTVTTTNISCSPSNSYLEQQVKEKMMANAPALTPQLMSNGKPRKVNKKQMLTFSK